MKFQNTNDKKKNLKGWEDNEELKTRMSSDFLRSTLDARREWGVIPQKSEKILYLI